eukprot:CAMPEP_0174316894 /NCGR_PEP_ID=MMETSP0810-20121108/7259_1 /TAXON_ID=73025 ORGANISM="Eutreptiella gymnastica-like, Strain CCMP1594" /NCGR_SAMPLE_ID=MMETSP0810 /ASSEMBLY_ACC=CAM_ASM_000659 /LENGTH=73 /DNA_ID=CAMNT_0015426769 /DNA_START=235 /DNA_END=457 /DNA_ORIENTATION=+
MPQGPTQKVDDKLASSPPFVDAAHQSVMENDRRPGLSRLYHKIEGLRGRGVRGWGPPGPKVQHPYSSAPDAGD